MKSAKLSKKLKDKMWGEAIMTAIDVENLLVSSNHEDPLYREFFKQDMPNVDQLRQFGEMTVIKTTKQIKGKLEDRGIPAMYLGRARDHAGDTFRFLNLETELVLISRDVIWLNKVYGDYKGTKLETAWDTVGTLPKALKLLPQPQQGGNRDARQNEDQQVPDHQGIENVRGNVRPSETQSRQTRSKGLSDSTVDTSGIK